MQSPIAPRQYIVLAMTQKLITFRDMNQRKPSANEDRLLSIEEFEQLPEEEILSIPESTAGPRHRGTDSVTIADIVSLAAERYATRPAARFRPSPSAARWGACSRSAWPRRRRSARSLRA